jgi:radical SAM superfamily enzyme YgiQ (UPF0313 family)
MRKGYTGVQGFKAVECLRRHEMQAIFSFVLGVPRESEESLANSLLLAERVARVGNVSEVFSNILLPIPGSAAFDELLLRSPLARKYAGRDLLPLEDMRHDWVDHFCSVPYQRLEEVRDEILNMFPLGSSFGKPRAPLGSEQTTVVFTEASHA